MNINSQVDISQWSGRKARTVEFLSQFDFELIYKSGSTNVADPLSRRPDYIYPFVPMISRYSKAAHSSCPRPNRVVDAGRVQNVIVGHSSGSSRLLASREAGKHGDSQSWPELGGSAPVKSRYVKGQTSGLSGHAVGAAQTVGDL